MSRLRERRPATEPVVTDRRQIRNRREPRHAPPRDLRCKRGSRKRATMVLITGCLARPPGRIRRCQPTRPPPKPIPGVMRACATKAVPFALVYSSGFAETGNFALCF